MKHLLKYLVTDFLQDDCSWFFSFYCAIEFIKFTKVDRFIMSNENIVEAA